MNTTIEYEGKTLSYSLVTNPRLKNLSIHIHPQKGVLVKNPGFSASKVHTFVMQKASWIFEKTAFMQNRFWLKKLIEEEGKIFYLGEPILLTNTLSPEEFYKEKTPPLVYALLEKWAFLMG